MNKGMKMEVYRYRQKDSKDKLWKTVQFIVHCLNAFFFFLPNHMITKHFVITKMLNCYYLEYWLLQNYRIDSQRIGALFSES